MATINKLLSITFAWLIVYCGAVPLQIYQVNRAQINQLILARHREAPYPPAGFRPNIPFELPTEAEMPTQKPQKDNFTPTPEIVYLPPATESATSTPTTPAPTYGPPLWNSTPVDEGKLAEDIDPITVDVEENVSVIPLAPFTTTVPTITSSTATTTSPRSVVTTTLEPHRVQLAPKAVFRPFAVQKDENEEIIPDAFKSTQKNARIRFGTRIKPRRMQNLI